jgi:two-component system chemotaxis response regulator CheY
MTAKERMDTKILIVDSDPSCRHSMRQSLLSLGFPHVSDASDYMTALHRLQEQTFTHLIFDSNQSQFSAKEFIDNIFELDPDILLIPSSYEPTIDDVFNLIISGARGYVAKPFTSEALDQAMHMATQGDRISDAILEAQNRNEALAALVLSSLDRLARVLRQAERFETAKVEIPRREMALRRSVELAKTYTRGGIPGFVNSITDLAIHRAETKFSKRKENRLRGRGRRKRSLQREPEAAIFLQS